MVRVFRIQLLLKRTWRGIATADCLTKLFTSYYTYSCIIIIMLVQIIWYVICNYQNHATEGQHATITSELLSFFILVACIA